MAWIAKPTRFLKSATILKSLKSIVQCQAKAAEKRSTYFFWNSTDNSCHLSNQNSEVCATTSEEKCSKEKDSMNELNEGSWTVQTKFCKFENYSYNCQGNQDIVRGGLISEGISFHPQNQYSLTILLLVEKLKLVILHIF